VGASDTKYNLAAEFSIIFPIGYDFDTNLLERQIRLIDQINPWVSYFSDGGEAPSIHWMSSITMREGGGIDRHYSVEIRPSFRHTFDQAYAYEQYANTLAKNLAQNLPSEAIGVKARLIVNGTFSETYRAVKN
jgi:hypothetical protein